MYYQEFLGASPFGRSSGSFIPPSGDKLWLGDCPLNRSRNIITKRVTTAYVLDGGVCFRPGDNWIDVLVRRGLGWGHRIHRTEREAHAANALTNLDLSRPWEGVCAFSTRRSIHKCRYLTLFETMEETIANGRAHPMAPPAGLRRSKFTSDERRKLMDLYRSTLERMKERFMPIEAKRNLH